MKKLLWWTGSALILAALLTAAVATRAKPPSVAACRAIVEQEWQMVLTGYQGPGLDRPKACRGLKDSVVEQIFVDVMKEHQ